MDDVTEIAENAMADYYQKQGAVLVDLVGVVRIIDSEGKYRLGHICTATDPYVLIGAAKSFDVIATNLTNEMLDPYTIDET